MFLSGAPGGREIRPGAPGILSSPKPPLRDISLEPAGRSPVSDPTLHNANSVQRVRYAGSASTTNHGPAYCSTGRSGNGLSQSCRASLNLLEASHAPQRARL
jgi:hypothetical protein